MCEPIKTHCIIIVNKIKMLRTNLGSTIDTTKNECMANYSFRNAVVSEEKKIGINRNIAYQVTAQKCCSFVGEDENLPANRKT